MNAEALSVTGRGRDRDSALANADMIAEQFYGRPLDDSISRTVGAAHPSITRPDGVVMEFAVEVTYE